MKCGKCNSNRVYEFRKVECCIIYRCDRCGAQYLNEWKFICGLCGKETDKLYDLFVPHYCKECSDRLHKEAKEANDYCGLCHKLRIDCYC